MANHKPKELVSLLAGKGGTLENIKFFRGDRDLVTADEIREQIRSAEVQKKLGRAIASDKFPDSKTSTINVKEIIDSL